MYVVLHADHNADADELIGFCTRHLATFKVPTFIEFVDNLPRTSVGKIQKNVLRAHTREAV